MPAHRLLAASAATLLLALAPAADAATKLPVGRADGVRLLQSRGTMTFVFGPSATSLWKAIAGKQVSVGCTEVDESRPGLYGEGTFGYDLRAPRRGRKLRLRNMAADGAAWCELSLRSGKGRTLRYLPVVSIPLTQAGAVVLDERDKASQMSGLLGFASGIADGGFPTPAQLLSDRWAGPVRASGLEVVALAAVGDTPPAGAYGYWSDGDRRAAVVTVTRAGRRIYIELGPDDELHTNVAKAINAGGR